MSPSVAFWLLLPDSPRVPTGYSLLEGDPPPLRFDPISAPGPDPCPVFVSFCPESKGPVGPR